jgi:hypothetical protein
MQHTFSLDVGEVGEAMDPHPPPHTGDKGRENNELVCRSTPR